MKSKLFFAENSPTGNKLKNAIPEDVTCISFPDFDNPGCIQWDDYIKKNHQPQFEVKKRKPDELATITFTSGSTGTPKGVMHDFAGISFAGIRIQKLFSFNPKSRIVSYLPLAHVAERALHELGAFYGGATMQFVENLTTFPKTMQDTSPDIFLAVPRIWQKFQEGILKKIPQKKLDTLLSIPVVKKLIQYKIKKSLGLLNARFIISGAAPLPPSTFDFFEKLDILIRNTFGMSETFAYAHSALQETFKKKSVGRSLPGVSTRISEAGEIQVKSQANMVGFYKAPELTKEAFTEDGFLKTGDVGHLDSDGFLFITGRLKDIFKTTKGEYIAPSQIESKLGRLPLIDQCCLVGSGMDAPKALLSLGPDHKQKPNNQLKDELNSFLSELNKELLGHEKISHLLVASEEWNAENGFLTPTMKIKRNVIEDFYKVQIDNSNTSKDPVMFI